jgi:phospholipase/lecithinase/hemolysin
MVCNPSRFGFTNSTGYTLAALFANPSAKPNDYLFWDGFHPTTNAYHFAAEFIYKAIASKRAFSENLQVPLSPGYICDKLEIPT